MNLHYNTDFAYELNQFEPSLLDTENFNHTSKSSCDIPLCKLNPGFIPFISYEYSSGAVNLIVAEVNRILGTIDCLKSSFIYEKGLWDLNYGTIPIIKTLTNEQIGVYKKKLKVLSLQAYHYESFVFSQPLPQNENIKLKFKTVDETQKMRLPFNYFMKNNITEKQKLQIYKFRRTVAQKARSIFPDIAPSQLWKDYADEYESFEETMSKNGWSKCEIIIRRKYNKLVLHFNRRDGDFNSIAMIYGAISIGLKSFISKLRKQDCLWRTRCHIVMLNEGLTGLVRHDVFNEYNIREICSYLD